jgi:RNA polymerase sigma-70 factor (ECF subfamily)
VGPFAARATGWHRDPVNRPFRRAFYTTRGPIVVAAENTNAKLDAFLAQVERRAYRMAYLATRHRDDALDVVQDAMCALVRSYADRGEAELKPLFYRILNARIVDWARRRKVRSVWMRVLGARRDEEQDDPLEAVPDPAAADPATALGRSDAMTTLERALRELPVRQRQAFLLRIWEGMDVSETARAMECSEGSVKTHLSRAVHALREILEDHV